ARAFHWEPRGEAWNVVVMRHGVLRAGFGSLVLGEALEAPALFPPPLWGRAREAEAIAERAREGGAVSAHFREATPPPDRARIPARSQARADCVNLSAPRSTLPHR